MANRVGEILEDENVNRWVYVPNKENLTDDCCRGLEPEILNTMHRWFQGPNFLRQSQEQWQKFPNPHMISLQKLNPELKGMGNKSHPLWVGAIGEPEVNVFEKLMIRRSSLNLIIRSRALIKRLFRPPTTTIKKGSLVPPSETEISTARRFLVKLAQKAFFLKEIKSIEDHKPLPEDSHLVQLSIFG